VFVLLFTSLVLAGLITQIMKECSSPESVWSVLGVFLRVNTVLLTWEVEAPLDKYVVFG
jgi:hypothetical protein